MSKIRKLKVTYKNSNGKCVPAIILQGKWLEQYGFSTGRFISVECEDGKLTITPREPEPGENKKSLEERISGMNKAQRKQILELLDELEEKPNT